MNNIHKYNDALQAMMTSKDVYTCLFDLTRQHPNGWTNPVTPNQLVALVTKGAGEIALHIINLINNGVIVHRKSKGYRITPTADFVMEQLSQDSHDAMKVEQSFTYAIIVARTMPLISEIRLFDYIKK